MTYTTINFKTKAELKRAVKDGKRVTVCEPGVGNVPMNGKVYLEGPHYPQPHTWYATAELKDGKVVSVK
jgi:hypothetical protein